ncbi:MAG: hypothetical protein V4760_04380 [Bdellovibrionota bacterium]
MKRVGELMKELGFREEASEETAKAFIENLVRSATGERWTSSKQFSRKRQDAAPQHEEQLSFDFGADGSDSVAKVARKSS